jgi:hypothetical protein
MQVSALLIVPFSLNRLHYRYIPLAPFIPSFSTMNIYDLVAAIRWLFVQVFGFELRSYALKQRLSAACNRALLALRTFSQTVIELDLHNGVDVRFLVTFNTITTLPSGIVIILPRR